MSPIEAPTGMGGATLRSKSRIRGVYAWRVRSEWYSTITVLQGHSSKTMPLRLFIAGYLLNHQLWFVRTSRQFSAGESVTPFHVSPFPQRSCPDHPFPAGANVPETNPSVRLIVNRSPCF